MHVDSQDLIVLSNREPYRHVRCADGRLSAVRTASGVVNAVEPLLVANGGVWVAEGATEADREAACDRDGVCVPCDVPQYRLRRVWLTDIERHGYYDGFANSGLWPLCHRTSVEPVFFPAHFHAYELVNRRFADAVCEEAATPSPTILVQDYHFALAPVLIRRQLPLSRIATFWHIPWPRPEVFATCPWSRTLLDGLLGSTSIGFQTGVDRNHFYATVEQLLHAHVDRGNDIVVYKGRRIGVGVFPASIDWPGQWITSAPTVDTCREDVRRELGLDRDAFIGVGVDRLDYSKGIEQKFLAIEWLLERRPDLVGRFVFVQLAEPTRQTVVSYRHTRARTLETAIRINRRFSPAGDGPIRLLEDHHTVPTVSRFFRAADVCYVGSLHDGMNLVSKEFVCSRDDEQGVLVLSSFAGASYELSDALVVNPYDLDAVASALEAAFVMTAAEQRARMRRMRRVVARANAGRWAARILAHVSDHAPVPQARGRMLTSGRLTEQLGDSRLSPA